MTKFIYIADTHLGASPMGYQQQRGYPERLPEILACLRAWLSAEGGVGFVLHGGDMVDSATVDQIRQAADLFRLPVPIYLCLGNHDLTGEGSLDRWLELSPGFLKSEAPDYTIEMDECLIHVVPNQWDQAPYYWHARQDPHFLSGQLVRLEEELARRPAVPHLVLTHAPVSDLPAEQTGQAEPYHPPSDTFRACLLDLARRYPQIRCILGAHNHLNLHVEAGGVHLVTVSALVETPFEFKVFEISPKSLAMSTGSLFSRLDFRAEYDFGRTFVQGRERDRVFKE